LLLLVAWLWLFEVLRWIVALLTTLLLLVALLPVSLLLVALLMVGLFLLTDLLAWGLLKLYMLARESTQLSNCNSGNLSHSSPVLLQDALCDQCLCGRAMTHDVAIVLVKGVHG